MIGAHYWHSLLLVIARVQALTHAYDIMKYEYLHVLYFTVLLSIGLMYRPTISI